MMAVARAAPVLRRVTVEAFLGWVYTVECADYAFSSGLQALEAQADGAVRVGRAATGVLCDRLRDAATLGVAVDSFGMATGGRLHPDAEVAHEFVSRLDVPIQALLIRYARAGECPDWHPGAAQWFEPDWLGEPAYEGGHPKRGRYRMVKDERGQRVGCMVRRVGPGLSYVQQCRAEWLMWVTGIYEVARHFMAHPGKLRDHIVVQPTLPIAPWEKKGLDVRACS